MKKILIVVVGLVLLVAFFFPKKIIGPQRMCVGFKDYTVRNLMPSAGEYTGGQTRSSLVCYGIIIPLSGAQDNFYGEG
jgi:predicted membrane protein